MLARITSSCEKYCFWKLIICFLRSRLPSSLSQWGVFFLKKTDQMFFVWDQKDRNFSKISKWISFFENWSNVFEILTSILSAENALILALGIKDRIKKYSFSKIVMTLHCSIKLVYWSQKLCKFLVFSLEFSKVLWASSELGKFFVPFLKEWKARKIVYKISDIYYLI